MTPARTKRQRLEAAGWVYVAGWLPAGFVDSTIGSTFAAHAAEAERIANTAPPRGARPKKREPTSR